VLRPAPSLRCVAIAAALGPACASEGSSDTSDDATSSSSDPSTTTATTDADPTTTTGAPATTGTGDDSTGDVPEVPPPTLPTPTGTCPELVDGEVMFAPAGIAPRGVRLWMSDAALEQDGPLVFYWHGTGSQPLEATYGLGADFIDQVVAQGGIIAAPTSDPAAGQFPWFLVLGTEQDDLLVADEVVACTAEQLGIDARRVHTIGMSAGGLQTSQFSWRRSNYLASAVTYSGGFLGSAPADADPSNPMAAMIFHGGADDIVFISFQEASERYLQALGAADRFGFICDHGMGHTIPQGDAQSSVWQFFYDHPWGTKPSPYVDGLPAGFPDYCAL
jgi:predicted esterase